jgi:hypothetical protein
MLPNGARVDERTRTELGGTLDEVLASLWPGDCQTCGRSIGSDTPSLVVDDLQAFTRATLHHGACRAPEWNDSFTIRVSGSALVTWQTVVLLLPFEAGGKEIRAAGLLVNPGLEEVWLYRDAGGWHPRLEASFASAGLTHASKGIPIRKPLTGVKGHLSRTSLSANVEGRQERFSSEAEYEIRVAAAQLDGFLLIVTHAADPEQMNPDRFMQALASPMTLVGWAQADPAR